MARCPCFAFYRIRLIVKLDEQLPFVAFDVILGNHKAPSIVHVTLVGVAVSVPDLRTIPAAYVIPRM